MDKQNKDDQINSLIIELGKPKNKTELESLVDCFRQIYTDGYRHSYSKMFGAISRINNSQDVECLANNIEMIKEYVDKLDGNSDLKKGYEKFFDHVSLECSRLSYISVLDQRAEGCEQKVRNLDILSNELNNQIGNYGKRIDGILSKTQKQFKEILTQMIAIVSIFTAVVFTALTSFNMITDIAGAVVQTQNYYWIGFVLTIVSFITINIFYVLLKFIARIIRRSIFSNNSTYIRNINAVLFAVGVVLFFLTVCRK